MSIKAPEMPGPTIDDVGEIGETAAKTTTAGGRRGMAITNRAIVGSVVGAGKALRAGGIGLSKVIRAGWRNKREVALVTATLAAARPYETADFAKKVVAEGKAGYLDPKGTTGSATSKTGQVLLDAADAAVSKARRGLESAGEKVDLPGINNHGAEPVPANPEKKN